MVQPIGIDLLTWAGTLFVDFPNDDIPVLIEESEWKSWGDDLIDCNSFALNDAPPTFRYEDWRIWAWEVYSTMANYA